MPFAHPAHWTGDRRGARRRAGCGRRAREGEQPYIPSQWRGLQRSQLQDCGEIVVEQRKGVEVRVFAGGRSKVLIDRWDGRNTWVFTPESDLHLAPGAVLRVR
ncbi:MAG: hypothetical protein R3E96_15090 [Planctomycetota bacterium]